jgi:hypothetical protein
MPDLPPAERCGSSIAGSKHTHPGFELLAPTFFEFALFQTVRPRVPVRYAGMRLSRWRPRDGCQLVVVCGLAGSLVPELRSGSVFIADSVSLSGGERRRCDPELVDRLQSASRSVGFSPVTGCLLTADHLVTGDARSEWATRGFIAADMETGRVPPELRVATLRVILDAPDHSISGDWINPVRTTFHLARWSDLLWLARTAPACARRAARIAAVAMQSHSIQTPS